MRALALAVLAVLLLSACAGSSPRAYSAAKTRECLVEQGLRIGRAPGDIVASTASGGAFRAHLAGADRNFVTL